MDPAAYYTYMATVMQHMATAGAEGSEGSAYAMDTGGETAVAAFAAADGGGGGGWAAAAVPGMEDAYRAQLEQHYCQYYQNYYSMMLTAKMAEVETWYTAAVAQEELEAMEEEKEKPGKDTEKEITTESDTVSNVGSTGVEKEAGDATQADMLTTQSTTGNETQNKSLGDVTEVSDTVSDSAGAEQSVDGNEGGGKVDANACSTMEEYYEKLNEYYRAYYEKFYADWFAKELKQHRRNVALERQRELDKRREERARELGLGEGQAITPEEFVAQQALFNKKNSRFQKEDSAGHWASKGLADDRDGRMMSIYFDAQSYQEEMNALKEKRERQGREFRAIKKKKHSTKHWKKLKEEKKRQKAAEWLLKD